MANLFDPYHKWLGIPPAEQPPNHYRLLGISLFEEDRDVIDNSAYRQMGFLRNFQLGAQVNHCQKMLNEVAAAKLCLLQEEKKAAYDAQLRAQLALNLQDNQDEPGEPREGAPPALSGDHWNIHVVTGPNSGTRLALAAGETAVIGRGLDADLQIHDTGVSRIHCKLTAHSGSVEVCDSGSKHGVYVGGRPLTEFTAQHANVFTIGSTLIRVESSSEAGKPPPQTNSKETAIWSELEKLVGKQVGKYLIDNIMCASQSGVTFRAHDIQKDRRAIVKVYLPEYTSTDERTQYFAQTAKKIIDIRHQNIVRIYGAGKQDDLCWIAMEDVSGSSLRDTLEVEQLLGQQETVSWHRAFRLAVDLTQALITAKRCNVVFQSIAPQNIMIRPSGTFVLCDLIGSIEHAPNQPRVLECLIKTAYLPPEQLSGQTIDCRTDLYGLGVTLYACVTSRPPFQAETVEELHEMIHCHPPERISNQIVDLDVEFENLIQRLMAKHPDNRFQSPDELLESLSKIGHRTGLTEHTSTLS